MPQNATENRIVPEIYYQMFLLRLVGLTYDQIADKTGYHPDHVRRLFSRGHAIYDLWQEWLKTAKENSVEEAKMLMYAHLPDIIKARIVQAKGLSPGANEAAKIILNYTLDGQNTPAKEGKQHDPAERITGFEYIIPQDPNETKNQTNMEAAPGIPSTTGSDN